MRLDRRAAGLFEPNHARTYDTAIGLAPRRIRPAQYVKNFALQHRGELHAAQSQPAGARALRTADGPPAKAAWGMNGNTSETAPRWQVANFSSLLETAFLLAETLLGISRYAAQGAVCWRAYVPGASSL
jgi:hypothetical protein